MSDLLITLSFSFFGGLLPALVWLAFWLREDRDHPEPKSLIIKTFFLGMLMVPVAFVFQSMMNFIFLGGDSTSFISRGGLVSFVVIVIWAFTEEISKYLAARSGGLKSKSNDEPIDVPIYLITAALGFAALENMLFLISPILEGNLGDAFLTGNMRFIGATLLHVSASALIGIMGSLSYFYNEKLKKWYLVSGFFLATLLHAIFNLFIINNSNLAYLGFVTVWFFVVLIIIIFEKIKKIKISKI